MHVCVSKGGCDIDRRRKHESLRESMRIEGQVCACERERGRWKGIGRKGMRK